MSSTLVTTVSLRDIELHTGIELCIDKPSFLSKQQVDVALESACCKRMF
jgi:hypothetical protein